MQTITIDLGRIELSDEEREAIRPMIRKDSRLPSPEECAEFIRQYGIDGINAAMGAER